MNIQSKLKAAEGQLSRKLVPEKSRFLIPGSLLRRDNQAEEVIVCLKVTTKIEHDTIVCKQICLFHFQFKPPLMTIIEKTVAYQLIAFFSF